MLKFDRASAIITRLGMIGDSMCKKFEVLGVQLDGYTAKEAMQEAIRYMETEPISTIEILAGPSVIELMETGDLREKLAQMDLLVVGDRTLLELSGLEERGLLREAETNLFVKMFLRYLKKDHRKVFLLSSNEERQKSLREYLERYYSGIEISGAEIVEDRTGVNDMIVNKINGAEIDCIISVLPSPLQEDFIGENKPVLDARIWMGLGEGMKSSWQKNNKKTRLQNFLVKFKLKSEMKKKEKEEQEQFGEKQ